MTQETAAQTTEGLRLLTQNLIDYAGLFPPANLDLKTVIKNYVHHLRGPYGWMLGKLICPVSQLKEAGQYLQLHQLEKPIQVSALVTKEQTTGQVIDEIDEFDNNFYNEAIVTAVEAKFSLSLLKLGELYETYIETTDEKQIPDITAAQCRVKLRCGGVSPNDFPSAESVAGLILEAIKHEGVLKFTAGLHHPIRHHSKDVGCNMHGFVNMFVGALLAYKHQLSKDNLVNILLDESSDHFAFSDKGLQWNDLTIDTKAILQYRKCIASSYGSCSFDEPITDLKTLGWLA